MEEVRIISLQQGRQLLRQRHGNEHRIFRTALRLQQGWLHCVPAGCGGNGLHWHILMYHLRMDKACNLSEWYLSPAFCLPGWYLRSSERIPYWFPWKVNGTCPA